MKTFTHAGKTYAGTFENAYTGFCEQKEFDTFHIYLDAHHTIKNNSCATQEEFEAKVLIIKANAERFLKSLK